MSRYLSITSQYREARPFDEALMETTVDNILALSTDDLTQYRAEVMGAAPGDPWRDHETEALRRADDTRNKERRDVA